MIKGEIWWAHLPKPIGSVPGKRRPVLIIQNDQINKSDINTVIVAAITSNLDLANLPGNLLLEKNDSQLEKSSVVNFSQIVTVDKQWLKENVGMLNKSLIKIIDEKLKLIFDID
jgi:mRNA interferase MazF